MENNTDKINRRRAPSTDISREKKLGGHLREEEYADLIDGVVIRGTQKGDIRDKNGNLHSVKSGKKWQVFLYGYSRIQKTLFLNILTSSLEAFPEDYSHYVKDREQCIAFKENFKKYNGEDAAKNLSNKSVEKELGLNSYIEAKYNLELSSNSLVNKLKDKCFLRNFLGEALFNNKEVKFLAIKDSTYKKDGIFKVFLKDDVLDILSGKLFPDTSKAGRVSIDFNVSGQKILLCYKKNGKNKNIVEIEIRNDSPKHYRQVRFNMYSQDTLSILLSQDFPVRSLQSSLQAYGKAIDSI